MTDGRQGLAAHWLSLTYLFFVAGFAAWACSVSIGEHHVVAVADDWRILDQFYSMPLAEWLLSSQNGHRIPATLLLYFLDYTFLDGEKYLLIIASLVTAWIAVAALFLGYRIDGGLATPLARVAVGFGCFTIFWSGACYTFVWGVCHANLMTTLWFLVSLSCLVLYLSRQQRGGGRRQPLLLVVTCVAAVVTTFSLGQGAGIWPALIVVSAAARARVRTVASLALAAVVTIAVYSSGTSDRDFSWQWPAEFVVDQPANAKPHGRLP